MEFMFHVNQVFGCNIIVDHLSTINISFVLMISVVVLGEQCKNL